MLLLLGSLALADVVGPEPTSCPAGSIGRSNHSGSWCEATHCDEDCPDGACREIGLCVDAREVGCGGMQPDTAEPYTFLKEEALRRCRTDADCDVGSCVVEDRCATGG